MPLDSLHKKPYEVLVLGRVQGDVKEALRYVRIFMVNVFLLLLGFPLYVSLTHNAM